MKMVEYSFQETAQEIYQEIQGEDDIENVLPTLDELEEDLEIKIENIGKVIQSFEAEKAGYNYITSVNPKTGNPRWYDILKKPQNRRVLELIRGVIAKKKQIDRELIDDRKDINPLYVFWIDDIMENRQKSIRRYKEKEKSDILSKLSEEEKEYVRKAREARKAKEKAKELEEADFFNPVRKTQERRNLFRKELRDVSKDEDEG